jgi:hypothetical protein
MQTAVVSRQISGRNQLIYLSIYILYLSLPLFPSPHVDMHLWVFLYQIGWAILHTFLFNMVGESSAEVSNSTSSSVTKLAAGRRQRVEATVYVK